MLYTLIFIFFTSFFTGYFEGYGWATTPEGLKLNRTWGKQEPIELYDNLDDKLHNITFQITEIPSNVKFPGNNFQIIALLYSSYKLSKEINNNKNVSIKKIMIINK